eukprot:365540-Chlamydomonas_euryale.AAC.1
MAAQGVHTLAVLPSSVQQLRRAVPPRRNCVGILRALPWSHWPAAPKHNTHKKGAKRGARETKGQSEQMCGCNTGVPPKS